MKAAQSKGLCPMHYRRQRIYGDPNHVTRAYGTGKKKHPLLPVYNDMLKRCNNPNDKAYKNYGGRGIKVCDRWLGPEGFANFLADMGPRPGGKKKSGRPIYTLDRIDNNMGYCPENCRWATWTEQGANRRNSSTIFLWGERYTLANACDIFGISRISSRQKKDNNYTPEGAFIDGLKSHYGERVYSW